jgi:DNA-binding NtrC family response regulator
MAKALRNGLSLGTSATSTRKPLRPVRQTATHVPVLLWIDDFAPALTVYKATMEALGFRVLTAVSGEVGLKLAALHRIDLVITDYEMPGMNGETVAAAIKSLKPAVPVIIFSGSTVISHRAHRYADAFCDKAGSRDRLLGAIHRLLHRKHGNMQETPPPLRASDHGRRTVA